MTAVPTKEDVVQVLQEENEIVDSVKLADTRGWDHLKLVGVLKSLEADGRTKSTSSKREGWKLTAEGEQYCEKGSPEVQVFNFIKANGSVSKQALDAALADVAKIGVGVAIKNQWVNLEKTTKSFSATCETVVDEVQVDLRALNSLPKEKVDALKKRKLIAQTNTTAYHVVKTDAFASATGKLGGFTSEMLHADAWPQHEFKSFNFSNASGVRSMGGALHPLMKVRTEIRNIMLHMGFEEMPTNQWVESSFWNFDTLYQPQQHPARDSHDTFFIGTPSRAQNLPDDYLQDVKQMHEVGGRGSTGWRYDWSEDEARKNILRTHTTAVSSRVLHRIAQEYKKTGIFKARKCFSIDRVFRNESLDATHLAEFHQVEGFVADKNLGLGHLIGVLREFFLRLGVTGLKFKPAYNPYTEPSMEIFGYHPLLKKTVELGNSGVFRPEMLLPMGLPEDVTVIAWGIGLERTAARMYSIRGIRELFSHEQDVVDTRKRAVSWLKRAEEE
mmetsp:Transcript_104427/g.207410  ORF Transcript_104427/g.207410 Transcript_104427/m.207410 type:complete len:500 (-) Transcript_104427:116-1615(-)|eukprot:CAMPEP_0172684876 /NCGR_PEP_ID=MMETSP1074-20121228/19865_1 /TAXON_ID=2916 /ORGANISM="Ceratium fusus, Strain PA161109" /LENGTH=499 /DNA_ID=CAMNT_0013503953 /DNA_START=45 /DNA_END=1544 /DNA_ORIENTATION=-